MTYEVILLGAILITLWRMQSAALGVQEYMRLARQDVEDIKAGIGRVEKEMEGIGNAIGDVCISLGDIGTQLSGLEKGTILSSLEMQAETISGDLKIILEQLENKDN